MNREIKEAAERAAGTKRKFRWNAKAVIAIVFALLLVFIFLVDIYIHPLRYVWVYAYRPEISRRGEGELRVHFVDVGQGDCTIIEFPDGKVMIIDGGDESVKVQRSVLGYCAALEIDTFDYLLLTHADSDHAGGLDDVLHMFGAETSFLPQFIGTETGIAAKNILKEASRAKAEIRTSRIYERIVSEDRDQFYYLMFLSPMYLDEKDEEVTANDTSAVVYLEYAGRRLLLPGDISEEVEDKLVLDYLMTMGEIFSMPVETSWGEINLMPQLEELDFLKAAHHGSGSSTGKALCTLCGPDEVFFSCGAGNGYGHPNLDSIANILDANPNAQIHRTDELGSIMLTIEQNGEYTVEYIRG